MHILIVDDREENRYLLESLLRGSGYGVQSVTNGAEAWERLKSGGVDLIISDILMPVMDGFELCRQVKASGKLRDIPFVVYTATYTGPQDEVFARKIGADQFIIKPCEPELLLQTVREMMAEPKPECPAPVPEPQQEEEILKLYNERLVRKLEQKMLQLEDEIQARRVVEETLRQSEKRYRSLYNSITDAIVVSDTGRQITDCNQAFVDLFGHPLEEVAGRSVGILYEEDGDFRRFGEQMHCQSGGESFLFVANFRKRDGTIFPGEANIFFLRNEGVLTGFIALIRDITERRRTEQTRKGLEAQLHQAQKMESVGRLAGGIAHDFNNLLSIILACSEIVLKRMEQNHPNHGHLDHIFQASLRASDLTRQLLAFSRKQILEMQVVDINRVAAGFEKLLRWLIGEDIRLVLEPHPHALMVKADTSQLEQVLMNLAVNARDAMPGGGTLTIRTTRVELDATQSRGRSDLPPGSYAVITVEDTGSGMEATTLEHLFEPFFTTKSRDKGTGLGLATSFGIVKQHGGSICVDSTLGRGASFRIHLPLSPHGEETRKRPVVGPEPAAASATVLVVEDAQLLRDMVCQMLTDQGYVVISTNDVQDAIDKARAHLGPIDLVLADVVMPGMKGPEVFARIRECHPEAKVLYMSGYSDDMISIHGVLKEGLHFLQKPFTTGALLEKCRQALHDQEAKGGR